MLPLRFELLLVAILVYFGNKNVSGNYVMPYGYDRPYESHPPLITAPPPPPPPPPPPTTTTPSPMTTTVEPSTPPETTTAPPISPCVTPVRNHRDGFLIKYYQLYNYNYPHGERIPVDRPPILFPPADRDPNIFNHGGLTPRQSAPLRHPPHAPHILPIPPTNEPTYEHISGPNIQGTMVTIVGNSPQNCFSSVVQSQSGMTVGWQGIGASSWRGYNPYNELLNHGRIWNNNPPPLYQPPQPYPID